MRWLNSLKPYQGRLLQFALLALTTIGGGELVGHGFVPGNGQPPDNATIPDPIASLLGQEYDAAFAGFLAVNHRLPAMYRPPFWHDSAPQHCGACHGAGKAVALEEAYLTYPRYDSAAGKVVTFRDEAARSLTSHMNGPLVNPEDPLIQAIEMYAATMATGRTFRITNPQDPVEVRLEDYALGPQCSAVFNKRGLPTGKNGPYIVQGCDVLENVQRYITPASVLNLASDARKMTCTHCHQELGDKEYASSTVMAATQFPQDVATMMRVVHQEKRAVMCITQSCNAIDPGIDSQFLRYLRMFDLWRAQQDGLPVKIRQPFMGIRSLHGIGGMAGNIQAGAHLYQRDCASCHGTHGYGDGPAADQYNVPPLWGPYGPNRSAGLRNSDRVAGFVCDNMPPGYRHGTRELTPENEQYCLHIAEFLSHQEAPEPVGSSRFITLARHIELHALHMYRTLTRDRDEQPGR